ncbi:Chlorophyll a-b binding protein CP29.1 [Cardamine amara subsp. amara]|uniref:Chlorophyll a-b binding protein CP29.1 n=1 Tax=Cardamine amara subsp. amara TaxID=228776 RepID=A0ABD1BH66_CARAN
MTQACQSYSRLLSVYLRRSALVQGLMCDYQRGLNGVHSQNDTDSEEGAKVFKLLESAAEPELLIAEMIGTRTEAADAKSTPFQPYSEVSGIQRFRECELIHGRWAMLATLGAISVEWLTGVTWQDDGKLVDGSSYLGQPLPSSSNATLNMTQRSVCTLEASSSIR